MSRVKEAYIVLININLCIKYDVYADDMRHAEFVSGLTIFDIDTNETLEAYVVSHKF
jgi:hypothetical protein